MAETERLVEFELLGQRFKFYTAASEEEMQSILALVRSVVENDSNQSSVTSPVGKIAVLACCNLASRYVKLQREFEDYQRESDEKIFQISEQIRYRLMKE